MGPATTLEEVEDNQEEESIRVLISTEGQGKGRLKQLLDRLGIEEVGSRGIWYTWRNGKEASREIKERGCGVANKEVVVENGEARARGEDNSELKKRKDSNNIAQLKREDGEWTASQQEIRDVLSKGGGG
ncbi:OLC1v1015871C1 [Oldenlandia corymbosa var. corymbosa]|uniref:OLC1v1015871C1 n=1 Tax=Oldenlandia corymbosa var. corymbosa TaxID=529605 RepID=A0AAV1E694_OLDCO|nr:OLC1v1015871C1 [Oldenlandia corymbosa var. corymbosa]